VQVYRIVGLGGMSTAVRKALGGEIAAGTAHCLVASTEKRSEDLVHPKISLPQRDQQFGGSARCVLANGLLIVCSTTDQLTRSFLITTLFTYAHTQHNSCEYRIHFVQGRKGGKMAGKTTTQSDKWL
jgi:hypothetical protein